MLSFGIVLVEDIQQSFYATLRPISETYLPTSMAVGGFTREQVDGFENPESVMKRLQAWAIPIVGEGRAAVWSDNPAFDWQFLNYYCHRYLGGNLFGHSARRIGDFYAGWRGNPRQTKGWKKWRGEAHTHNALEDARGNARALQTLLRQAAASPPRK